MNLPPSLPKWHFDWFSTLLEAHQCVPHTDTQTTEVELLSTAAQLKEKVASNRCTTNQGNGVSGLWLTDCSKQPQLVDCRRYDPWARPQMSTVYNTIDLPGWAGTRKVKPIWILLKQETVSGSGITWATCSLHLAPDRQPRQHPTTQN